VNVHVSVREARSIVKCPWCAISFQMPHLLPRSCAHPDTAAPLTWRLGAAHGGDGRRQHYPLDGVLVLDHCLHHIGRPLDQGCNTNISYGSSSFPGQRLLTRAPRCCRRFFHVARCGANGCQSEPKRCRQKQTCMVWAHLDRWVDQVTLWVLNVLLERACCVKHHIRSPVIAMLDAGDSVRSCEVLTCQRLSSRQVLHVSPPHDACQREHSSLSCKGHLIASSKLPDCIRSAAYSVSVPGNASASAVRCATFSLLLGSRTVPRTYSMCQMQSQTLRDARVRNSC
jgi:hypothetical protein